MLIAVTYKNAALDKLNVNEFIWGIFISIFVILCIFALYFVFTQEKVDILSRVLEHEKILKESEKPKEVKKSKFQVKLEKMAEERNKKTE